MKLFALLSFRVTSFVLNILVLFIGASLRKKVIVSDAALTSTVSWSAWGHWTDCNPLDGGRRSRSRKCVDSKGITQTPSNCGGPARRTRQCESCAYPVLNHGRKSRSGTAPLDIVVTSPSFRQTSSKTAWCSSQRLSSGHDEYLEFAFKNAVRFTAIGTRGYRGNSDAQSGFVMAFKLMYSYDGAQWLSYANKDGEVVFKGNIDTVHQRRDNLEPGFVARYVRVYPTNYNSRPCLDVALYGCEYSCGGLITEDPIRIIAPNAAQLTQQPDCLWRIQSKVATKLRVVFPYFKILDCRDGFLSLRDGSSPFHEATFLEEFCGQSQSISDFAVKGGNLWLHYQTNATSDDIGFELRINTITTETLNSSTGEVTMPKIVGGYAHWYRYHWLINSPENGTIILTIHNFTSDNMRRVNGKCIGDTLVVHEGNKPSSLVGKYCDDNFPKVVVFTRNYLRIKFRASSDNPKWKLHFSFKTPGSSSFYTTSEDPPGSDTVSMDYRTEVPSVNRTGNRTIPALDATQWSHESASKTTVIVASILSGVVALVFLLALAHYLRKRKAFLRKHPYDCSTTRPMSHFGDQDSTPFINTNVLMWSDSNSRNYDKEKPIKNGKNSLPFVTVALREDGPQRLSVILPEMLSGNSQLSLDADACKEGTLTGSLVVSDAFTEECMQLLNNNLGFPLKYTVHDTVSEHEERGLDSSEPFSEGKTSPEDIDMSPEDKETPPEVINSPEVDEDLSEVNIEQ